MYFLIQSSGLGPCPSISNQQNVPQTHPKVSLLGGDFFGGVSDFSTKVRSSQMCQVDEQEQQS